MSRPRAGRSQSRPLHADSLIVSTGEYFHEKCHWFISGFYNLPTALSPESKLTAWKADLRQALTVERWRNACKAAQTQTGNTCLKWLQYNWPIRVYITPGNVNLVKLLLTMPKYKGVLGRA